MRKNNVIKNINISLTNRCNLKCRYCDIWKQKPKLEISLKLLEKILNSKCLDRELDITFTGGEPFLHSELFALTKLILSRNSKWLKTISTNGTLKDLMFSFFKKFKKFLPPDFSLHISIDGIKSYVKLRRYPVNEVFKNISFLRKQFPNLNIKIKFLITPLNYTEILPTYIWSKLQGLELKLKLVEYAYNYTNRLSKPVIKFSSSQRKEIIKSLQFIYKERMKNTKDALFIKETINFLLGVRKKRICKVPFNRIFVFPEGNVYSCLYEAPIGNLHKKGLDDIWNSQEALSLRKKVIQRGCNRCISYHGFSW